MVPSGSGPEIAILRHLVNDRFPPESTGKPIRSAGIMRRVLRASKFSVALEGSGDESPEPRAKARMCVGEFLRAWVCESVCARDGRSPESGRPGRRDVMWSIGVGESLRAWECESVCARDGRSPSVVRSMGVGEFLRAWKCESVCARDGRSSESGRPGRRDVRWSIRPFHSTTNKHPSRGAPVARRPAPLRFL